MPLQALDPPVQPDALAALVSDVLVQELNRASVCLADTENFLQVVSYHVQVVPQVAAMAVLYLMLHLLHVREDRLKESEDSPGPRGKKRQKATYESRLYLRVSGEYPMDH